MSGPCKFVLIRIKDFSEYKRLEIIVENNKGLSGELQRIVVLQMVHKHSWAWGGVVVMALRY
jgi:hypothetical protein